MYCEKCGHEMSENQTTCSFCGRSVEYSQMNSSTQVYIQENLRNDDSLKSNPVISIRLLGIVLMVISGIADLVSMCMVGTSDVEAFSTVLTIGSITFFIGLVLCFSFHN